MDCSLVLMASSCAVTTGSAWDAIAALRPDPGGRPRLRVTRVCGSAAKAGFREGPLRFFCAGAGLLTGRATYGCGLACGGFFDSTRHAVCDPQIQGAPSSASRRICTTARGEFSAGEISTILRGVTDYAHGSESLKGPDVHRGQGGLLKHVGRSALNSDSITPHGSGTPGSANRAMAWPLQHCPKFTAQSRGDEGGCLKGDA